MVAITGVASAQTVQGVVTGTITDTSGAVLPNVSVTLTNDATGIVQTETTLNDGVYRFALVPPGVYTLSAKSGGFTEHIIKGIKVDASKTIPVNATLTVATASTTVEVSAQENIVQTESFDLATTVNLKALENAPLITRNVYDLAFLAPSVTQGMNGNAASGGARESGTAFLLNGADNNNNFNEGSFNITPPLESVGEFTVLTNSMSAQYGRAAGAIVSASQKSGTNRLHGAAYEYNRNRSFNSSDFFSNRQGSVKPKYIRNQFGGEIDGPIIKDKTFFAFAYDQVSLKTGGDIDNQAPTASELAAITNGAGPLAQYYLQKYPLLTATTPCPGQAENAPESIGHIGCIHVFDPNNIPQHNYFGKLDHSFGLKDRLSFTANFNRLTNTDLYGGGHPYTKPISSIDNEHYHNLGLVETHIFSPRIVNELTIAHNRHYSVSTEGNGKSTDPEIAIDGANYGGYGFGFGAFEGGLKAGFVQDRWQAQDNLSYTVGRHSLKLGGGMQYGIFYRDWDLGSPGYYEFGNTTGVSAADAGSLTSAGLIGADGGVDSNASNFQKDFPYFQELSIDPHAGTKGNAYRHFTYKDANVFVNDDWKFSKRLTLTLGLRWERYGAPSEVNGKLAQFTNLTCLDPTCIKNARVTPVKSMWKTNNRDFAPRVGFAWDVFGAGKTSVRGGYGISYDRIFDNVWSNGSWNPPFYALLDLDATGSDVFAYTVPGSLGAGSYVPDSLPGAAGRVSVRTMDVHLRDASVNNYYMGVEHQIFSDFLVRVNYQGSFGRHLPVLMNLNRYDGQAYNKNLSSIRPNPLYTGFNYRANNVNSNYNAMIVELQKRFSRGLQFQGSYAWSKLMDYGSDLFTGETGRQANSQPYYAVSNAHRNFDYGPGAFDHTHTFKLNFVYEIPFFKAQQGFFGQALGGWQLSAFYQGYSGHPLEIYNSRARKRGNAKDPNGFLENIGGDYNLDGLGHDRPDYTGTSFSAAYSNNSPADGIFKDNNPIGCGAAGQTSTNIAKCNAANGVTTPNTLFVNPAGNGIRFGNLGRNTFRGPWFNGLNSSLTKSFKIRESLKLQVRFDALNVLNHPNFDNFDTNLNSSNFGRALSLVGDSFDTAAVARRLQLGARIVF